MAGISATRILILDDELFILKFLVRMLVISGFPSIDCDPDCSIVS